MRRNKIPLSAFIGVNLVVVSLVFLSVFFNLLNQYQFGGTDHWELLLTGVFLLAGGAGLLTGIGLILRKKWARIVLNIILLIGFIFFAFWLFHAVSEFIQYPRRRKIEEIGPAVSGIITVIGIFLFLNNSKVVDELG